jgi:signal peptidase I
MSKQESFVANVQPSILAAELVHKWGFVSLPAVGTSMLPVIHPGDQLEVERADLKEILPGDIVVYARHGRLIVHRVVSIGTDCAREAYLITRGDRSPSNDSPVFSSEVLGLVRALQRGRRCFQLRVRPSAVERVIRCVLRSSDRATYVYVRASALCRRLRVREAVCQR